MRPNLAWRSDAERATLLIGPDEDTWEIPLQSCSI